jgi:hypothetical protein
MRDDIEKRLHRVMIKIDHQDNRCPYSKSCENSESSARCNLFYQKCAKFIDFDSHSL